MSTIKIINVFRKESGNLKAFCTVVLNDKIEIRDCKIMNGSKGLFLAMPSRQYQDKDGNTKYQNIVVIKDEAMLAKIQEAALKEFGGPQVDDSAFPF